MLGHAALALLPMAAGLVGLVYGVTLGRRQGAEQAAHLTAEVRELHEASADQFLLGQHQGFTEGAEFERARMDAGL
jgi:hypothetical protein